MLDLICTQLGNILILQNKKKFQKIYIYMYSNPKQAYYSLNIIQFIMYIYFLL